jgi:hypothetical protein
MLNFSPVYTTLKKNKKIQNEVFREKINDKLKTKKYSIKFVFTN